MSTISRPKPISPVPDLKTRRITLISFWSIFLLLGAPLWWKTTALEQRKLPGQRIQDWDRITKGEVSQSQDGRVVKYSPHYKLVFSLLNENSSTPNPLLSWDIDNLLQRHFKPLLSSLSPLHNFTIESQVQYYAPLAIDLESEAGTAGTWVGEQDVKAFVNNAEWNLASGTTLDPVLHFILFVPASENRPMEIKTSQGTSTTSFITPQRGGLVIYNPSSSSTSSLDPPFHTFSRQLKLLLGLPLLSPSATTSQSRSQQIESLIAVRLAESLKDTTSTLTNLIQTITEADGQQASNISVGLNVQSRVVKALDLLDSARDCQTLIPPCSLSTRLSSVSQAQQLANRAYFDPTLLPMLYFPQEHKYAVYTPLFGPVSVPLIVGLIRELKEWRKNRKEKKERSVGIEREETIRDKVE